MRVPSTMRALRTATRLPLIAVILVLASWARPAAASPYDDGPSLRVDVGIFYDDLAPHGRWVDAPEYGWVFVPRVAIGWRPYTLGHWVWTDDYGWLWVSDEEFGWAVYHYGRWYDDPAYGWAWVPGTEWAPAWVSFRTGGGYVGWAPLPPRATWQAGVGFRVGNVGFDALIGPTHYCFVPERAFLDRSVRHEIVPAARNVTIVNVTRNVTSYTVVQSRVVNRSISLEQAERAVRRPVPRLRTVEVGSVAGAHHARDTRGEVAVFRPSVRASAERTPPHAPEAREREERDHERQRADLERRQARERQDLEREHERELKQPPRDVSASDLERRHEREHAALDERQHREHQQLESAHSLSREARDARPAPPVLEARAGRHDDAEARGRREASPSSKDAARSKGKEKQADKRKPPKGR